MTTTVKITKKALASIKKQNKLEEKQKKELEKQKIKQKRELKKIIPKQFMYICSNNKVIKELNKFDLLDNNIAEKILMLSEAMKTLQSKEYEDLVSFISLFGGIKKHNYGSIKRRNNMFRFYDRTYCPKYFEYLFNDKYSRWNKYINENIYFHDYEMDYLQKLLIWKIHQKRYEIVCNKLPDDITGIIYQFLGKPSLNRDIRQAVYDDQQKLNNLSFEKEQHEYNQYHTRFHMEIPVLQKIENKIPKDSLYLEGVVLT